MNSPKTFIPLELSNYDKPLNGVRLTKCRLQSIHSSYKNMNGEPFVRFIVSHNFISAN